MPFALEHIRRMRGGAQSHLLRCDDGRYYIVKFRNNPQHGRVLANELLGTRLAARLGIPVPPAAIVTVSEELIAGTEELCMELGRGRRPCEAGQQFGSQYPGDPATLSVTDYLPDEQLRQLANLSDFWGMLTFDKWTCNTNGRQAIFFRSADHSPYGAMMIDQGFCFNAGSWDFPDAPLRGLYFRGLVYEEVRGMDSFAPWLERLARRMSPSALGEIAGEIPPSWYDFDQDALDRLLEMLLSRKNRVEELLVSAKNCYRQPFPNWR
jgi:HipA-like kinase